MGIIIELLIEGIAWILFEVIGELVGEGISSAFGRNRRNEVAAQPHPGAAPGTVVGQAGVIGGGAPADGSGWAQAGSAVPGEAAAPVQPGQPPAQVPQQPQVQAAVHVDASGCATWLMGVVMVAVMAGVGFWWGQRRYGIDPDETPATLWVGVGLAVFCLVLALVQVLRTRSESEVVGPPLAARAIGHGWQGAILPWRWAPARLVVFGLANVALAAGVAVGFQ